MVVINLNPTFVLHGIGMPHPPFLFLHLRHWHKIPPPPFVNYKPQCELTPLFAHLELCGFNDAHGHLTSTCTIPSWWAWLWVFAPTPLSVCTVPPPWCSAISTTPCATTNKLSSHLDIGCAIQCTPHKTSRFHTPPLYATFYHDLACNISG